MVKATGRMALILAIGLLLGFPATVRSQAAASGEDTTTRQIKHTHRYVHHRYVRTKSVDASKDADAADVSSGKPAAIPAWVANANAQLTPGDGPSSDARPVAAIQVVAADQLNEVDQALQDDTSPAPKVAAATSDAPAPRVAPVMASGIEHSAWNETSLIGKIFIGFGALLTVASAARMFMA